MQASRQSYPHTHRLFLPDKLPYRDLHRPRPREGCLARRTTKVDWESCWPTSRPSNLAQGPNMYQRTGDNHGYVSHVPIKHRLEHFWVS